MSPSREACQGEGATCRSGSSAWSPPARAPAIAFAPSAAIIWSSLSLFFLPIETFVSLLLNCCCSYIHHHHLHHPHHHHVHHPNHHLSVELLLAFVLLFGLWVVCLVVARLLSSWQIMVKGWKGWCRMMVTSKSVLFLPTCYHNNHHHRCTVMVLEMMMTF